MSELSVAFLQLFVSLAVETLRAFVWAVVLTLFFIVFAKGRSSRA